MTINININVAHTAKRNLIQEQQRSSVCLSQNNEQREGGREGGIIQREEKGGTVSAAFSKNTKCIHTHVGEEAERVEHKKKKNCQG